VAGAAGALFGKAHALSDEVHHAMVSRGYTGTPRTLAGLRVRTLDWLFAGATAMLTVAVLGGDRILGR
jgi:cobalt/nickel transport system permease protein